MSLNLQLEQATTALLNHEIVVMPTETVYGLAARADSAKAIEKIYSTKGRPSNNPLIVHFHSITQIKEWLILPELAQKLAQQFWPGPLTLVIPSTPKICLEARAKLDTVAIRIPNHPVALALLKSVNIPLAAPSANRSGHISPTQSEHVRQSLGSKVKIILEGGGCRVGVESTVLDLNFVPPKILRPGKITKEQIEKIIGKVEIADSKISNQKILSSPGLLEKHYAPSVKTLLLSKQKILNFDLNPQSGVLSYSIESIKTGTLICLTAEPQAYASQLYAALYRLEKNCREILIETPPPSSEWLTILNRVERMVSTC